MLIRSHDGEVKNIVKEGRIDRPGRVGVPQVLPFKTVGTYGICPGGLPKWPKLLTKLAATVY